MPIHHMRRAPKGKKAPVVRRPPTDVTHMTGTADGGKLGALTVPDTAIVGLAATKLGSGPLPAGVSVDGSNLSGLGGIGAGAGAVPARNLASGYDAANLVGTLSNSRLSAVPASVLATELLSSFKAKAAAEADVNSDANIAFGTTVSDTTAMWSGSTITPHANVFVGITARAHLRSSGATIGTGSTNAHRAQLYVIETGSAIVVAASEWFGISTASDGTLEIIATLSTKLLLAGAKNYVLRFKAITPSGGAVSGTLKLKAESLSATPYLGGSFIEAIAIARF